MRKNLRDQLRRLVAAELAFAGSEFLAPVARGHGVIVKIAGARCALEIDPPNFRGWGLFRADSFTHAALLREASATQRRAYLRLFSAAPMIVCAIDRRSALAVLSNPGEGRMALSSPAPVQLCALLGLFDAIIARFDGNEFWFDALDPRADPAAAAYLRAQLANMVEPDKLDRPGLAGGQRAAYALEHHRRMQAMIADHRSQRESRLAAALAHAGAELRDFTQDSDTCRVTFTVDGHRHSSVIHGDDLTVRSAGICLSGEDEKFDLSSLVGVLRESNAVWQRR